MLNNNYNKLISNKIEYTEDKSIKEPKLTTKHKEFNTKQQVNMASLEKDINNYKYTLQDVKNIMHNGFNYQLPEYTLKLINKIACQVGSPNYIKTPIFKKRENKTYEENDKGFTKVTSRKNKKKRKNKQNEVTDFDWETLREFETTKIEKKEEGIENEINKIRILLNKLSNENYDDIVMEVNHKLAILINENEAKEEELYKLGEAIFEIGSQNSFYSQLYATLYKDLMNNFEIMKKIFDYNYSNFIKLFENIDYVDPNEDYDKFCCINLENERRRSLASFMSNLVNKEVIKTENIIKIINEFIELFKKEIENEGKKPICEEIVEILFNILEVCSFKIYQEDSMKEKRLKEIQDKLDEITEYNIKEYKSLTNKSIFKLMDIIDHIQEIFDT